MRLDIITIFPEYFAPLDVSLLGRARRTGILDVRVHDLRQWTHDRHHTVDDTPYGGGPGMVMKPEPWGEALATVGPGRLIVPTPSGTPFTQATAAELAAEEHLIVACGRYEGIDARVVEEARERMPVDEVSLGDFVLAGGEVAALVMVEAVGRLLPGVLGNADSVTDDSFAPGAMESLLEGPVYTKPPVWRGRSVPDILLSGHHGAIARWRRDEALRRTARNRPELVPRLRDLDEHDRQVLREAGFPVDGEGMAH
jgi:tRNA (guanine37-N1)-methyltransferase